MTAIEDVAAHLDVSAFQLAAEAQRKRELDAVFARKCLAVATVTSIGLVLCVAIIAVLLWRLDLKEREYFAAENGRVTRIYPLDQPAWSSADVVAFGSDTIRAAFTLDFVNRKVQMSNVQIRFNDKGYEDYFAALTSSNLWSAIEKERMNLSTIVEPGVVTKKGSLGGVYTYQIQYPVAFKLDGQRTSNSAQQYYLTLQIQQVDPRNKAAGLEVTQVITSTR